MYTHTDTHTHIHTDTHTHTHTHTHTQFFFLFTGPRSQGLWLWQVSFYRTPGMSISTWTVYNKLPIPSLQRRSSDATCRDSIIGQAYIWWVYLNVKITRVLATAVYERRCVKHKSTLPHLVLRNIPGQLPSPPCNPHYRNFSASPQQGPMSEERSLRLFPAEWQMVVTPQRLSGKGAPSTAHGQPKSSRSRPECCPLLHV